MIFSWIRRNLDLDGDREFLDEQIVALWGEVHELNKRLAIQNQAMGRIIAKLDPMFVKPEVPPTSVEYRTSEELKQAQADYAKRLEESNRLGEEAINRIVAEHDARSKHGSGSQGTY